MPSHDLTKQYLSDIMVKLAERVPFDKITVADLTQQANINRKTFYYHFVDKYDLLSWFFNNEYEKCHPGDPPDDFWRFYAILVTCMDRYRVLYKNIFSSKDKVYFEGVLRRFLHQHMLRYVPPDHLQNIIRDKYDECIKFLCTTFAASLEEWIVDWPNLSIDDFIAVTHFDKIV